MERLSEQKIKNFTTKMQARLLLVFCIIILLLIGLIGRLIYLTQVDGDRYAKKVLSRQAYVSAVLPYKRGDILDRNGTVLASSELQYKLIVDPKNLILNEENLPATMSVLKKYFKVSSETIQTLLKEKPDSQYVILLKNLKYQTVQDFKKAIEGMDTIKGVWFEEEYVRTYPYNTLASDLIGFTSTDNIGYWGMEEYYNDELNGTNGREYGYYDADLNIDRTVKAAEDGNSIVSTIDANVQRIVQKHIVDFNTEYGSENIGVIVMNPNNGEILAMASNEEYDLNKPRSLEGLYTKAEIKAMSEKEKTVALNEIWRNYCISNNYEPGSTFKPFTVSAALEEDLISDSDTFLCDGSETVDGQIIHCSKTTGHGVLTLAEVLMKSCNDALMQIVAKEGKNIFYHYQKDFGFGAKTGIDLPGEEAGILTSLDKLSDIDLAISSFGQTSTVTMLQMASAYSAVVNGGTYYQPHMVKQIVNSKGATVKQIDKVLVGESISKKTSDLIQEYMYRTVEEGTAKGAKVPGYSIGGKTGTAETLPRGNDEYLVSFLGEVPAINPEVVIYIVIDKPQNVIRQDDSSLATKLASKILNEILPTLGIYPDGEIDYLLPGKTVTNEDESNLSNAETENLNQNSSANTEENTTENNSNVANGETPNANSSTEDNTEDDLPPPPGTENIAD